MSPATLPADQGLEQAVHLAHTAPPVCGDTRVVAVDGPSGSGKTQFGAQLAERLGAPVLHLDDLYPGWDGLAEAVTVLTTLVLEPLAHGERAAYRRWDWMRSRWGREVLVPPTALLVVEGVGASVRPAGDRASVRLWLDAPEPVRYARAMARDGETYRPHWDRWARQEQALFSADGTAARADLHIDTSETGAP